MISELSKQCEIHLLELDESTRDKLLNSYTFYTESVIPKGTYNNQTEDIHTVGVKAVLLVSDKLPEKTVKALTKTLFENKQELQYALPVNIVMNEQTATEGITIPFHKGAAAYYKECGIDVCVNTLHKDFGEAMVEAFGPDKADVIYDCAGNNITMGQAIKYARKGSVIVLVAVFAGMAEVDLAVANDHELDIKSTMMYRHDDYVDGIRLVNEGKVHLKPLISKTFAFKDYLKAYQYIDDNRETTMKVIINVQEQSGDMSR